MTGDSDLSVSLEGLGLAAPGRLQSQLEDAVRGELEIVRLIARGGMGLVFLARDVRLDRDVAIKVLLSDAFTTTQEVERFKREAQTVAALDHPNIVPVYSVREHGDLILYIMQYVDGGTLEHLIAEGPVPIERVVSILTMVGAALDHAHARSFIHRDVKPANILLDAHGRAFVMDFGIAKVPDRNDLTKAGTLVGTPIYASPEQCRGESGRPESDQYSLGVVAYEMLTGEPPFDAPSLVEMIEHHLDTPAPSVAARRPDCPPALARAVARMLAKSPDDRWPSLERALRAAAGKNGDVVSEAPAAPRASVPRTPSRRRAVMGGLAVAVLAVAVAPLGLGRGANGGGAPAAADAASARAPTTGGDAAETSTTRPAETRAASAEPPPGAADDRTVAGGPDDPTPPVADRAPPPERRTLATSTSSPSPPERPAEAPSPGTVLIGTRGIAAVLYVDDVPMGAASRLRSWSVPAGRVAVSLRAEGCTSWDSTVVVPAAGEVRIGYRMQTCTPAGGGRWR